jgi:predicted secreted hydrolase
MKNKFVILAPALVLITGQVWAETPATTADGFALPEYGHQFVFPDDYGSHEDFKIEWWYVTGHLFTEGGRRFGFQATFFRSASPRHVSGAQDTPDFGNRELFFAHMAVLDTKSGTFVHQQRLNRDGWDAFSATNKLDVRNGNWSLCMTNTISKAMTLHGSVNGDVTYDLRLLPRQPLVVFGTNSVSRKAEDPAAASYYLTFPRLAVAGVLNWRAEKLRVRGQAWMDHEISSSQLGRNQAGWDWSCLQLDDGREIMAYRMRREDGSQDRFSTLAWVSTNGLVTQLPSADFSMETLRTWKSPASGAKYPVSIKLLTREVQSRAPVTFALEPLADNQEIAGGELAYWEGACRVRDAAGREVGSAFLELTGYARSFAGVLH